MDQRGMSKGEFLIATLVCVLLLLGGLQMAINIGRLRRAKTTLEVASITRVPPAFSSESGIDINGHPVIPMPPPFEQRAVVFMLHSATMDGDLKFWTSVSKGLSDHSHVRLIAYCNDDECARLARTSQDVLRFPVVQYAEVQSGEALVDADSRGEAIVRSEEWLVSKTSRWRGSPQTPNQFIEAISQL